MGYIYSVVFNGDHVEVKSKGDKSFDSAKILWAEITRTCEENNCFKVLGIAESDKPMPILDGLQHEKLFKAMKISFKYKIAWVEKNKKAQVSVKFLENYICNRGLADAKLFHDVDSAKKWLLG